MKPFKKETIKKIINELNSDGDRLLEKYDYDIPEYNRLTKIFKKPTQVKDDDIKKALKWKYKIYFKTHWSTTENIQKNWNHFTFFLSCGTPKMKDIYKYWEQKGCSCVTSTWFAHLTLHNDKDIIPIIDQHNFRALNYYAEEYDNQKINNCWAKKGEKPTSYDDLLNLKKLIIDLLEDKELKYEYRDLDIILMMYGKELSKMVSISNYCIC